MIRYVLAPLLLLGAAQQALAWQAEAMTTRKTAIRSAPGPYDPLSTVKKGTRFNTDLCFDAGEWCKVEIDGQTAFISGNDAIVTSGPDKGKTLKASYKSYFDSLMTVK